MRSYRFSELLQTSAIRFILVLGSLSVVVISVVFTLNLAERLKKEERLRVEQIALAQISILKADENCDLTFQSKLIESNRNVPMILTDAENNILDARNYSKDFEIDPLFFKDELIKLKAISEPIVMEIKEFNIKNYIYYRQSKLISYLEWFPYIEFSLLFVFIGFAYLSFSFMKKSQQERVWVGMAKETAHQLGTPLTSLIAWIENLKILYPEEDNILMISNEMHKDLEMLEIVASRFSKIGAKPELKSNDLYERLEKHYNYIKQRAPRKVSFEFPKNEGQKILVNINPLLFDWVIENLLKNALDAMNGQGFIKVELAENNNFIFIDISDSGKGIPKHLLKKIFKPGFSTKKRGWGLGLSLCKRIIENYHKGKIFVKKSVPNHGTTFRIQLPKIEKAT